MRRPIWLREGIDRTGLLLVRVLSGIGYGGLNHYDHNCPMREPLPGFDL